MSEVLSGPVLQAWLRERDPRLVPALAVALPDAWPTEPDLYRALLHAIISQQLSIKAADTIHGRFLALFPDQAPSPQYLLDLDLEILRSVGISRQKARYLQSVAVFTLEGQLQHEVVAALKDEEALAHLTRIKGVGRWTAQMLLMFSLGRPDVLPVDDVGIQNAMRALYGIRVKDKALPRRMAILARPWRPYRSTVCRYLWRWVHARQQDA